MQEKVYHSIDKTSWPRGPWDGEPDKAQWPDEATGLPCLAVRGPVGAWCGYVGTKEGHPFFGVSYSCGRWSDDDGYDTSPEGCLEVHCGLTFSDFCQKSKDETTGICHVPGEGEDDRVWWLGFDCAHAGDITCIKHRPMDQVLVDDEDTWPEETYKTLAYVHKECASLADQLNKITKETDDAS